MVHTALKEWLHQLPSAPARVRWNPRHSQGEAMAKSLALGFRQTGVTFVLTVLHLIVACTDVTKQTSGECAGLFSSNLVFR
jgi:hypothetical protein